MSYKYIFPKLLAILVIIITIASCEEEFSTIDTNLIDENFDTESIEFPVKAYSRKLGPVQTNDLVAYKLGVYNDPVYGKSTSSFLTQVTLGTVEPEFGDCTVLDSVVLYLPFFSTSTTTDDVTTYEVDSLYGETPISINIYESNLFLRDLDPSTNFEESQNYYSTLSDELLNGNVGTLLASVNNFRARSEPIVLNDSVSLPPGLRVKLPNDFFQEKIIDNEGEEVLLNNNNFREFFRGIYFEASSATEDGNLFIFDPVDQSDSNLGITLYTSYKELPEPDTPCSTDSIPREFRETRLLFNANSVNLLEDSQLPAVIENAVTNPNTTDGEETLYLKGGEGIVTIIDLFGDDVFNNDNPDQYLQSSDGEEDLEDLREEEWIINEANLIFYVDQDQVTGGSTEPERLIIYETKNQRVLVDFSTDLTSGNDPVDAYTEHLGRLERGSDDNGDFYKIKITSHLSNLINNDSINSPLALLVSQNVTQLDFQDLEDPILLVEDATNPDNNILLEEVPATSIISPEGTVLHGNRSNTIDKRLKLQIYYTKPE